MMLCAKGKPHPTPLIFSADATLIVKRGNSRQDSLFPLISLILLAAVVVLLLLFQPFVVWPFVVQYLQWPLIVSLKLGNLFYLLNYWSHIYNKL